MDKDQDRITPNVPVAPGGSFISFDDLMKQQQVAPGEAPKEDFRSLDAVMKDIPKQEPKGKVHPMAEDIYAKNRYLAGRQFTVPDVEQHRRNYLGDAHAYFPEDDDPMASISKEPIEFGKNYNSGATTLFKDEEGKWTKFDPKKHVSLFDEKDGKAKVFKRTPDTDYGRVTGTLFGLASILGDSIHLSPITSTIGGGAQIVTKMNRGGKEVVDVNKTIPGSRIPMTAGQETVEAVGKIKEATAGKAVPAKKGFADTWSFFGERKPKSTGVEVPVSRSQVAGGDVTSGGVANNVLSAPAKVIEGVKDKAASAISHVPGGGMPFVEAANQTARGFEEAVGGAASAAVKGNSPTNMAEAGDRTREAITNYIAPSSQGGKLAGQVDKAYAKVDPLVSPTATQPLTNTMKAATAVQSEFAATKRPGISPIVQQIAHAVTDPAGLTYGGIKTLRSEIGSAIRSGSFRNQMLSDMEVGNLKQLHTGLTADLRELILKSGGAKAVTMWEKANDLSQARAEKVKHLATIIGSDTRGDEAIFSRVVNMAGSTASADIKKLALARKAMGAVEWRNIASAATNELGYTRIGNAREFSIDKFMKDYGRFSESGKNILFGESTPHRIALDNLVKLGESWPKMKDITSPSGDVVHLLSMGALFHHFTESMGIMFGARSVASVMARPVTADSAARWLQSYKVFSMKPTRANAEIFTQATRRVGEDLAKEEGSYTNEGAAKVGKFTSMVADKTGVSAWWQGRKNEVNDK